MVGRSIYRCRVTNSLIIRCKTNVGTIVEPLWEMVFFIAVNR